MPLMQGIWQSFHAQRGVAGNNELLVADGYGGNKNGDEVSNNAGQYSNTAVHLPGRAIRA